MDSREYDSIKFTIATCIVGGALLILISFARFTFFNTFDPNALVSGSAIFSFGLALNFILDNYIELS